MAGGRIVCPMRHPNRPSPKETKLADQYPTIIAPLVNVCSIDGCDGAIFARGWCNRHYKRWYRHGDPAITSKAAPGEIFAWIDSVMSAIPTDECVIFPFGLDAHGYGQSSENGKKAKVHRVVCERTHGMPPSPNAEAAHSCGVRACANPRHLRWATRAENEADKITHGTLTIGERHGMVKLTEGEVLEIRRRSEAGETQQKLGVEFGVSKTTIGKIVRRERWSYLP